MADRSKRIVITTIISIIANVVFFFVEIIGLIVANTIEINVSEIFVSISGVVLIALWPLANLILSVISLVLSIKNRKSCIPLAVTELVLSIAGPLLFAFTYLLEFLYRGF